MHITFIVFFLDSIIVISYIHLILLPFKPNLNKRETMITCIVERKNIKENPINEVNA